MQDPAAASLFPANNNKKKFYADMKEEKKEKMIKENWVVKLLEAGKSYLVVIKESECLTELYNCNPCY